MLFFVIAVLCALQLRAFAHGQEMEPSPSYCSADAVPCGGPDPACCPSGFNCNFRRGIPVCRNPKNPYKGGYNHQPCLDPYFTTCDLIGISGFCCPIGTICFNDGTDRTVYCIDVHGTTSPSLPSATSGAIPSASSIPGNDSRIIYAPSDAWNISNTDTNCKRSNFLYTTDTINASISFSYFGPSIEVHTVTAPNGGVFSIAVDGFNTSSTIDTFSGPGQPLPLCYPNRFPPMAITPTGFSSQKDHTITLVFIGPSVNAPANSSTVKSIGQVNLFAIPSFTYSNRAISSYAYVNVYVLFIVPFSALFFII